MFDPTSVRTTHTKLAEGVKKPLDVELEFIWYLMEEDAEAGWLSADHRGIVDQEVDEDALIKLLKQAPGESAALFGFHMRGEQAFNVPTHLCGYYNIYGRATYLPTRYVFEQFAD